MLLALQPGCLSNKIFCFSNEIPVSTDATARNLRKYKIKLVKVTSKFRAYMSSSLILSEGYHCKKDMYSIIKHVYQFDDLYFSFSIQAVMPFRSIVFASPTIGGEHIDDMDFISSPKLIAMKLACYRSISVGREVEHVDAIELIKNLNSNQ